MAEEKKEKVNTGDVLRVLAKHAPTPSDPDDADTLSRWNQQVADEQAGDKSEGSTSGRRTP